MSTLATKKRRRQWHCAIATAAHQHYDLQIPDNCSNFNDLNDFAAQCSNFTRNSKLTFAGIPIELVYPDPSLPAL